MVLLLPLLLLLLLPPPARLFPGHDRDRDRGRELRLSFSPDADEQVVAPSSYRLPTHVRPLWYRVRISPRYPDLPDNVTDFEGSLELQAEVRPAADWLVLHAGPLLTVSGCSVEGGTAVLQTDPEHQIVRLQLPWSVEGEVTVQCAFEGSLGNNDGLYKSSYSAAGVDTWLLLVTQFEPTLARSAFPCLDEPAFKAPFEMSVDVPRGYRALSNSDQLERRLGEGLGGTDRIVFKRTPPMATYSVAFVVFHEETFVSTDTELSCSGVRITSWGPRDQLGAGMADYSVRLAAVVLDTLENYTGIPFTNGNLTKIDQVPVKVSMYGAVENWGLVTYDQHLLLIDTRDANGESSEHQKELALETITHELVHMWFGNLVTPEWWDFLWLKEAFASFMQYMILDVVDPGWRLLEQMVVEQQLSMYEIDSVMSAIPVASSVTTPAQILRLYGRHTYQRGGCMVRMIWEIMGPQAFQDAMRDYLKERAPWKAASVRRKGGTARPEHLFSALDRHQPAHLTQPGAPSLGEFLRTWMELPGLPLITVTRDPSSLPPAANVSQILRALFVSRFPNGRASYPRSQERFLLVGKAGPDPPLYPVLLTWADADGRERSQWLTGARGRITGLPPPDRPFWLRAAGYFRVIYDARSWRQLAASWAQIPELQRAVLLDDACNLARAGRLPQEHALQMLALLRTDPSYLPWAAAEPNLEILFRHLPDDPEFLMFLQKTSELAYQRLGFVDSGSHYERLQRKIVVELACRAGNSNCLLDARQQLRAHVEMGARVPTSMRQTVYCYGALQDAGFWGLLLDRLDAAVDKDENLRLALGLACSDKPEQLLAILKTTLNASAVLTAQAVETCFKVAENSVGRDLVFNFITDSFVEMEERYGIENLADCLQFASLRITSEAQADKVRRLAEQRESRLHEYGRLAVKSAEENMAWLAMNKESVHVWLDSYNTGLI